MKNKSITDSPWLMHYPSARQNQNKSVKITFRLFCFCHAGGSASAYRDWAGLVPDNVEVVAIQLPGREGRFSEPLLNDFDQVVDQLATVWPDHLDLPYAIFGHSMGSLLAFEMTRRLRQLSLPLPVHLFVSGRMAPQLPYERDLCNLTDGQLHQVIIGFAGTNGAILANPEIMAMVLPIFKADFRVHESYQYREQMPLDMPMSIFGGEDDPDTSNVLLEEWGKQTNQASQLTILSGGHFFVEYERQALMGHINATLTQLIAVHCEVV